MPSTEPFLVHDLLGRKRMKTKNKTKMKSETFLDDAVSRLRTAGLKITPSRKKMLQIIQDSKVPLSAENISARLKSTNLVTIYRNLSTLQKASVLSRCDLGDGVARFELGSTSLNQDHHHHHHLVCRQCKRVISLPHLTEEISLEDQLNRFSEVLCRRLKFSQIDHRLEFFGICQSCA